MIEAIANARQVFANRADTEHEVALFRLALIALVFSYFLITGSALRWITLLCLVFFLFAAGVVRDILVHPEISIPRRIISIFIDQLFLAGMLGALGEDGSPFLALFLIVSIDNALRYGRRFGYLASLIGAMAFMGVHATHDFWQGSGKVGLSWLVAMVIVPPYVSTFSQRIKRVGHRYRRRAQQMAKVALEDPLTGIWNRASFNQHLARSFLRAQASGGQEGFAVLYIDLDGFKAVNDQFGHPVGDALLQEVAKTLKACVRGTDHLARLGGDEFAIVLNRITDVEVAKRIGAHVVDRVQQINSADGNALTISCSVGLALSPSAPREGDLDRVLAAADQAMYEAKRAGKNQLSFKLTPSI
jgi:diguanylate cyclase (GGDEF)-like protein